MPMKFRFVGFLLISYDVENLFFKRSKLFVTNVHTLCGHLLGHKTWWGPGRMVKVLGSEPASLEFDANVRSSVVKIANHF